jgi:hypothetical protein
MLSEALRVPYRATDATGTLLVGTVLTGVTAIAAIGWLALLAVEPRIGAAVTPVVFLLSLVVRGYLVRVVGAGISDRSEAPSFVRWGSLLRDGATSGGLSVIYALPAAVFFGLAAGAVVATVIDPPGFAGLPRVLAAVAMLIGGFGLLCYLLVYLYLRPAAQAVLAATGSLRAAVDPRRVFAVALSGTYLNGWLLAIGLVTVGPVLVTPLGVLAGVAGLYDPALGLIGGLGTLLGGVIVLFSLRMSAAWAIGRGAATVLATDLAPPVVVTPLSGPSPLDTGVSARTAEAPPAVQVGRGVDTSPTQQHPDGGADRSIDLDPPEPTQSASASGDDTRDESTADAFEWSRLDSD